MKRVPWYDVAGFVAWGLLTAALTLTPVAGGPLTVQPLCLFCGDLAGADLIRNFLLFAPAGVFLARRGVSVLAAIGIGLAMSVGIEFTQLFVPGRYVALRDLITNGLGAGAGAAFYSLMVFGVRTGSRFAIVAASVFPVAAVAATGWLMQPTFTDGVYFGHWVPEREYYAPWNGVILEADVNGVPAPSGPIEDTDAGRSALEAGRPVHLRFIQGDPPSGLAALFHVVDDSKREILMIGAVSSDLVVRPRLRATEARLDFTDQRFVGFLNETAPGDTVSLHVSTDARGRSCATIDRATIDRATTCAPYPSLGSGWQLILWKGALPELARRALHGATVLLLLLPLSILSVAQPRPTGVILLGFITVAMILVGRGVGLAWPGIPELVAAAAAMFIARRARLP